METSMITPSFKNVSLWGRTFYCWDGLTDDEIRAVLSKLDIKGPDDCWPWLACIVAGGYGQVRFMGKTDMSHRAVFTIFNGPIPPDIHLHHNPSCVKCCGNPEHLTMLSPSDHQKLELGIRWQTKPTHCPYGHLYSAENTYVTPKGIRSCRTCHNANSKIYYENMRATRKALEDTGEIPKTVHNAFKDSCPMGHEYTPENTYMHRVAGRNPSRMCKTCHDARGRYAYYKKTGQLEKAEQLRSIFEKVDGFSHTDLNEVTAKLACPMGHTYLPDNFYEKKTKLGTPGKICKICTDARNKAVYYRKTGNIELAEELEKIYKKPPAEKLGA